MNGLVTWEVDLKLTDLVIAKYEDWTFFISLRMQNYVEGFEPFRVDIARYGDSDQFVECYTFEQVVDFIDRFVNGHPHEK